LEVAHGRLPEMMWTIAVTDGPWTRFAAMAQQVMGNQVQSRCFLKPNFAKAKSPPLETKSHVSLISRLRLNVVIWRDGQ
jgi:hypothetical protein